MSHGLNIVPYRDVSTVVRVHRQGGIKGIAYDLHLAQVLKAENVIAAIWLTELIPLHGQLAVNERLAVCIHNLGGVAEQRTARVVVAVVASDDLIIAEDDVAGV